MTADGRVRLAASQPWLVDAAQTWMAGVNNAGAANTWKLQDPTGRRVTGTGIGSR